MQLQLFILLKCMAYFLFIYFGVLCVWLHWFSEKKKKSKQRKKIEDKCKILLFENNSERGEKLSSFGNCILPPYSYNSDFFKVNEIY